MRGCVTDAGQTNERTVKIELLSRWKLEAEFRNFNPTGTRSSIGFFLTYSWNRCFRRWSHANMKFQLLVIHLFLIEQLTKDLFRSQKFEKHDAPLFIHVYSFPEIFLAMELWEPASSSQALTKRADFLAIIYQFVTNFYHFINSFELLELAGGSQALTIGADF